MSATSPNASTVAETVAQTALATAQSMMPVIIAAAGKAAIATDPRAAAAIFASEMVGYLIQVRQAQPSDILTLYAGIGPTILAQQAVIDAEAAARGVVADPTVPAPATPAA